MPDPLTGRGATAAPPVRLPAPLRPGDVVGVTAPSSGVSRALWPRLEVAVEVLRRRGYRVRLGRCLEGSGIVSAPAEERAAELMAMLLDPQVRAVVPPWGGELAVEVLPHLDFAALEGVEPTWVVGYSDLTTLLVPLTTRLGWVTLHGQNLMDTPYRVPEPLLSWLDVVAADQAGALTQGPSLRHRRQGHDDWVADSSAAEYAFDTEGGWRPLDGRTTHVEARGRLIGGCVETLGPLAGTAFADVASFADRYAPEGTVVYVEAAEEPAPAVARHLWAMRLAGWFDRATAVLVGRTTAPDADGFTQVDASRSALGDLGIPVLLDVDCGHVPPHLALLNGTVTAVRWTPTSASITQALAQGPTPAR